MEYIKVKSYLIISVSTTFGLFIVKHKPQNFDFIYILGTIGKIPQTITPFHPQIPSISLILTVQFFPTLP